MTKSPNLMKTPPRSGFRYPIGSYELSIHDAQSLNENSNEFLHSHPFSEMYFIKEGEVTVKFDDTTVDLERGELIFIAPGLIHKPVWRNGKGTETFVMDFDLKKSPIHTGTKTMREDGDIEAILKNLKEEGWIKVCSKWDAAPLLAEIETEQREKDFAWSSLSTAYYLVFFTQAIRQLPFNRGDYDEDGDSTCLANRAYEYMQEHYAEKISLSIMSEYLGISERHVNRVYLKKFGTTFARAIRTMRLTYAKHLLKSGDMDIEEIAEKCGFNSARSFRKMFRDNEGICISTYLKKRKPKRST